MGLAYVLIACWRPQRRRADGGDLSSRREVDTAARAGNENISLSFAYDSLRGSVREDGRGTSVLKRAPGERGRGNQEARKPLRCLHKQREKSFLLLSEAPLQENSWLAALPCIACCLVAPSSEGSVLTHGMGLVWSKMAGTCIAHGVILKLRCRNTTFSRPHTQCGGQNARCSQQPEEGAKLPLPHPPQGLLVYSVRTSCWKHNAAFGESCQALCAASCSPSLLYVFVTLVSCNLALCPGRPAADACLVLLCAWFFAGEKLPWKISSQGLYMLHPEPDKESWAAAPRQPLQSCGFMASPVLGDKQAPLPSHPLGAMGPATGAGPLWQDWARLPPPATTS